VLPFRAFGCYNPCLDGSTLRYAALRVIAGGTDMATPNDLTNTNTKAGERAGRSSLRRYLWFIGAAGLIAIITLGLIQWQRRWDHPQSKSREIAKGVFTFKGNSIDVSIQCDCPDYFIDSQPQSIAFTFDLKRVAQSTAEAPAPNQENSPASQDSAGNPPIAQDLNLSDPFLNIDVLIDADGGTVLRWPDNVVTTRGMNLDLEKRLPAGIHTPIIVSILPGGPGSPRVTFRFREWNFKDAKWGENFYPYDLAWYPEIRPSFRTAMWPYLAVALLFVFLCVAFFAVDNSLRRLSRQTEKQLSQAQAETRVAWASARIKLEDYLTRNLIQVKLVFWVAVCVMATGFGFVLQGVFIAIRNPDHVSPAALAVLSGMVTQFIGATFLVIYRSTMQQASDFMKILERINTVGMAVDELDRIPDAQLALKNEVRARLVELLVSQGRLDYPKKKSPGRVAANAPTNPQQESDES